MWRCGRGRPVLAGPLQHSVARLVATRQWLRGARSTWKKVLRHVSVLRKRQATRAMGGLSCHMGAPFTRVIVMFAHRGVTWGAILACPCMCVLCGCGSLFVG